MVNGKVYSLAALLNVILINSHTNNNTANKYPIPSNLNKSAILITRN